MPIPESMTIPPEPVVWVMSAILVEAAVIDGWKLKVPNWLTFNFLAAGILYWTISAGLVGLEFAMLGFAAGFVLYPLCAVGGMGAGDVKLLFGIGAWTGWKATLMIFALCAVVGGVMAIIMMVREGDWAKRVVNIKTIMAEFRSLKDLTRIDAVKAKAMERKEADLKAGMLLPYGIPMVMAAIGYFVYAGWYFQG